MSVDNGLPTMQRRLLRRRHKHGAVHYTTRRGEAKEQVERAIVEGAQVSFKHGHRGAEHTISITSSCIVIIIRNFPPPPPPPPFPFSCNVGFFLTAIKRAVGLILTRQPTDRGERVES